MDSWAKDGQDLGFSIKTDSKQKKQVVDDPLFKDLFNAGEQKITKTA